MQLYVIDSFQLMVEQAKPYYYTWYQSLRYQA